jgi:hypothetical protein
MLSAATTYRSITGATGRGGPRHRRDRRDAGACRGHSLDLKVHIRQTGQFHAREAIHPSGTWSSRRAAECSPHVSSARPRLARSAREDMTHGAGADAGTDHVLEVMSSGQRTRD